MPTDGPAHAITRSNARPAIVTALCALIVILGLRMAGPWDILDNDQLRPLSYILDIIRNANWLVQHDWTGEVASKPPLYAWIGALPALLTDRVGPLELAVPSALGVLIGAIAVALASARALGTRPACLAVLAFLGTPMMIKQATLARTDGLYAGLTTAAALLAFRAWTRGRGWREFWIVAALATLTKGPLAVVLAPAGLLFVLRSRPPGVEPRRQWPEHALGLLVFLALAGGWFASAWIHEGQPFIDKVLGRELFGHVVGASKEHLDEAPLLERVGLWFAGLFKPTLYLLWHGAPWSVLAAIGLVRTFRAPSDAPPRRALERFCAGWLIVGLAIFSVVPHQRPDLLSPIWAPGAILAASLLADRLRACAPARARLGAFGGVLAVGAFVAIVYIFVPMRTGPTERRLQIDAAYNAALELNIPPAMITPLDGPYLFTAHAGVLAPRVSTDQAARLLRREAPAFVSTIDPDALVRAVRAQGGRAYALVNTEAISVVSNRRELRASDSVSALLDGLLIETAGARLGPPRMGTLIVEPTGDGAAVVAVQNQTDRARVVRWRTTDGRSGEARVGPLREAIITIPRAAP